MGDGVRIGVQGCALAVPHRKSGNNGVAAHGLIHAAAPLKGFDIGSKARGRFAQDIDDGCQRRPCPSRSDGASSAAGTPPDGSSAGRVCIAAGTHGDEMMGQLIVYLVQQRIGEHPDAPRHGGFLPHAQPARSGHRRASGASGTRLDMNRAFPARRTARRLNTCAIR